MNTWQELLNHLKTKVNPQSYQTWLRPTRLSHSAEDTLFVRVPNREFQDWIQEHYGAMIRETLEHMRPLYRRVCYVFGETEGNGNGGSGQKAVQGKLDFESVDNQLNPK